MKDVVTIAPTAREPGLVAYECPNCRCLMSVRVSPTTKSRRAKLLTLSLWRAL
jgi:hypothetical protein